MKEIKSIAIWGAGAMGAFFSSSFFQVPDISTALIAKGERFHKLEKEGLIVNGTTYGIPVVNPENPPLPFDLIVVALKHHHLVESSRELENLVSDDTLILSVMNGLDSEPLLGSVYGEEKVLLAVSVGIDAVRDGNRVVFSKPGVHYFGEADNSTVSDRVASVQSAFEKAGIKYETPVDMLRIMWWKFMINVGMNPTSAVMGAPYGVFQKSQDAAALMMASMQEVISLARAKDINLGEKDLENWLEVLNTLSPQGKTSMLQDMEAGTKTEAEILCDKVVNLGKSLNIPTPVNQTISRIVHVMEERPRP